MGFIESVDYTMKRNHFVDFFRTLSYREFLTVICLATFTVSLQIIREFYYWENDLIESSNNFGFNFIVFTLIIYSNHFIYKLEHKRFNVFYVRVFIDLFFFLIYVIFKNYLFFEIELNLENIIIAISLILILESLFSSIKIIVSRTK